MTDAPFQPEVEDTHGNADSLGAVLDELESVLDRQSSLSQAGKDSEVLAQCQRVDRLLQEATRLIPTASPQHIRRLQAVSEKHRKLALMLAQQKQDASEKLGKLRRGQRSLDAYQNRAI